MHFPELYEQVEGDTDKVASRVAWEYLEGMNWVLRYYACGPAALDWRQQQHDSSDAAGIPGASWSWCYSFHYAPLMQVCCAVGCSLIPSTVQGPAAAMTKFACLLTSGWTLPWLPACSRAPADRQQPLFMPVLLWHLVWAVSLVQHKCSRGFSHGLSMWVVALCCLVSPSAGPVKGEAVAEGQQQQDSSVSRTHQRQQEPARPRDMPSGRVGTYGRPSASAAAGRGPRLIRDHDLLTSVVLGSTH